MFLTPTKLNNLALFICYNGEHDRPSSATFELTIAIVSRYLKKLRTRQGAKEYSQQVSSLRLWCLRYLSCENCRFRVFLAQGFELAVSVCGWCFNTKLNDLLLYCTRRYHELGTLAVSIGCPSHKKGSSVSIRLCCPRFKNC